MHRTRLRLKGDLDKIASTQTLDQTQQAAGCGNGLEFAFSALAIFQHNQGGN
jgi:hypothetical protein